VAVPNREKPERLACFFLDPLHLGPLHLADPSAIDADQMIVMRPLKLNLKLRLAARRGDPFGQPAFLEHLERPEYRHFADPLAFEGQVDLIHRDMPLGMQEKIHNLSALLRKPQPLIAQIFLEDLMDPRRVAFAARGPGWEKDKFLGRLRHGLIEIFFQEYELGAGEVKRRGRLSVLSFLLFAI
jgi:hypothetical protein